MMWVCIKDDACEMRLLTVVVRLLIIFQNRKKRAYTPYFLLSCIVSMVLEIKLIILRNRAWIQCNTLGLTLKIPVFLHFGVPWTYGRQ